MSAVLEEPQAGTPRQADRFEIVDIRRLFPSPTNPRKKFDEAKLAELADSIKAHGVIQPCVARPTVGDQLEIIAGERRYRASKIAGMPALPCMIRDLSDEAVLEIQVIENNQREDVHPLEESEGYRRLLDSGAYGPDRMRAVAALAQRLGRSESYVWTRMKLIDLVPVGKTLMLEHGLSASHAILVARLRPEDQYVALGYATGNSHCDTEKTLEKQVKNPDNVRIQSVRNLENYIFERIMLKLSKAPFNGGDANLLPMAGSCLECPKRTGSNKALFPELGADDCCLDSDCWAKKSLALVEQAFHAAEKEHGPAVNISLANWVDDSYKGKAKLVVAGQYSKVKKGSCEFAQPGVVAHTGYSSEAKLGDVIFVCASEKCKTHRTRGSGLSEAEKAKMKERERGEKIEKFHRKSLFEAIVQFTPKELNRGIVELVLVTAFGIRGSDAVLPVAKQYEWEVPKGNRWDVDWFAVAAAGLPSLSDAELVECCLALRWGKEVDSVYAYRLEPSKALEAAAAAAGIDVAMVRREAEEKFPPKVEKGGKAPRREIERDALEDLVIPEGSDLRANAEEIAEWIEDWELTDAQKAHIAELEPDVIAEIMVDYDTPLDYFEHAEAGTPIPSPSPSAAQTSAQGEGSPETQRPLVAEPKKGGRPKGSKNAKDGDGGTAT